MANGINYQNSRLVVNEPTFGKVNVFKWNLESENLPVLEKSVKILMIADNVNFDKNGDMLVGGWMGPLMNSIRKNHNMKSMIVKIDKDSLEPVQTIFYDLEGKFSVSSAANYNNYFWIGSPTRPLLFCKN